MGLRWRRSWGAGPSAVACALACLLGGSAGPAAAASLSPPPDVEVGRAELASPDQGPAALLIPVRYPIQLAGRLVETRVRLIGGGRTVQAWTLHERLGAGRRQLPERRRSFTFVHRIGLRPSLARRLRAGLGVRVTALGRLDANGDGKPELSSSDSNAQSAAAPADGGLCSSSPQVRLRPGQRISLPLPICGSRRDWDLLDRPRHGSARIGHGRLIYRPAKGFRGTDTVALVGLFHGRRPRASAAGFEPLVYPEILITVGNAGGVVVRALGDSVTAGYGYYDDGSPMPLLSLLECRPGAKPYNDACSSNSPNTDAEAGKLAYAPDYGLSNNVSWAAQWTNENGITNYENLAVSGSEPADWAPGGGLHETTARIESEDPDYVLMTVGANPLLSEMLTGIDKMGCAIFSQIFGGYSECIEEAFAEVHLPRELKKLYTDLVQHTQATIFLMQYHLSIPSIALAYSATQIAEMGKLLNREIAKVAGEVSEARLQVIAPPHFNVGVDISPVYPSHYSCSRLGFKVDGPSVQTEASQDELLVLHPLSFCSGPVPKGPEWVIGGDTGIHPSATGYEQMASRLPPPSGS
ncbi:MAG TPA: SGNH/GDSL hydrolase family protein [Solirubrobacterales bacterium]|jgi:lysophospholipase L1-like esterase|nr:SGNH/GDSL hydrolase family protein [Solirubrobacterales bacterium]